MSTAAGFFRSSRIDRRLRDSGSTGGSCCRPERSGRSICNTSAPRSARTMQPNGAGARLATSMTLTPARGPVRLSTPIACHAPRYRAAGPGRPGWRWAGGSCCGPRPGCTWAPASTAALIRGGGREAGEGAEVRGALPALDPPRPLPADRGFKAERQCRVEVVVGVAEHAAEHPVDLLGGYRCQRQAAGEVDIPPLVRGEVHPVHQAVALQQEPVERGGVLVGLAAEERLHMQAVRADDEPR